MFVERSFLFVPGDRPERYAKAFASGTDRVVIDLEDAVLPDAKAAARDNIANFRSAESLKRLSVRINGIGTTWHADDLRLIANLPQGLAVILPKAENRTEVEAVASRLTHGQHLIALIETANGYLNRHAIAGSKGLTRLAFGSVDFSSETGVRSLGVELDPVRLELVVASTAAGLAPPVEGVTMEVKNAALLTQDIERARRLGFGGKLCIHPIQVEAINTGFSPSPDELRWAERVMEASQISGAAVVDGKLVDKPVVDQARRILGQRDHLFKLG